MRFEQEGLFLGLISYPFYIDGGQLYDSEFEDFFSRHREEYLKKISHMALDADLYRPVAYKMFGNYGLLILSLMDDYAFCCRIFNSGHILDKQNCKKDADYKSVVLAGSSELFDEDICKKDYLHQRAKETFLRKKDMYPFIGLIRMKLDYQLLKGRGWDLTSAIKKRIEELKGVLKKKEQKQKQRQKQRQGSGSNDFHLDNIIVDAYDNDEIVVLAFSNSFRRLDSYLKDIRRITMADLNLDKGPEMNLEKRHVCTSCHMSYGYHRNYSFESPDPCFYSWDKPNDIDTKSRRKDPRIYSICCLIETKPGHRNDLCKFLSSEDFLSKVGLAKANLRKTVTGGSIVRINIPLEKVEALHAETSRNPGDFNAHVRRVKLTLDDCRIISGYRGCTDSQDLSNEENTLITSEKIGSIKKSLTRLGVSKAVRERLLALLDLFNDCGRNKLQRYNFEQMKPAVLNISTILEDFEKNEEDLLDIENKLNEEINSFETAFYNRMHNKMSPNTVLEYSGGIQQFIQAFSFAYKGIVRVFSPSEAEKNYALITGVSKESSYRTHTELNINHIVYPQLFCVTTWKEASNFTLPIRNRISINNGSAVKNAEMAEYFEQFQKFIEHRQSFESIKNLLLNQTDLVRTDLIYQLLDSVLSPEAIKYSLQDYLVYHFAFNRDFVLMWRYYWKIFLQTSSVYRRRGEVKRRAFIFHMLRLFLVAYRESDSSRRDRIIAFLEEQQTRPFDYLVASLWFECFQKVSIAAKNLCRNLQTYSYQDVSEEIVLVSEHSVLSSKPIPHYIVGQLNPSQSREDAIRAIVEARSEKLQIIVQNIEDGQFTRDTLEQSNLVSSDKTICMLGAFLIAVDRLDNKSEKKSEIIINTVPRDNTGEIDFLSLRECAESSSDILADPSGGFLVANQEDRKKYYLYRTLLYRSLWDLSYFTVA